ncbi:MAG: hypothetical protein HFE30_06765 [Clostridiales bacterium]|nr:hypothetical protein [Clostridiales bacterium]
MFGRKKGWTRSKNPDSKRYKNDMAAHLNGMPLKCVCEKVNGIEEIVGKSGAIAVRDGELMLYAGMDIVLRCDVLSMSAWELMSLDGVVITAPDLEHGGTERTVTAYYSYWRSMNE